MARWSPVLMGCLLFVALAAATACGDDNDDGETGAFADRFLRIGEDAGTEVETFAGKLPRGLDGALNPDKTDDTPEADLVTVPQPPDSELLGSARVVRSNGQQIFFIIFEVKQNEPTVAEAIRGLLDETPWQVIGGQSSTGVSAYRFQNTRSGDLQGTAVVQPLPTSNEFDVVISRDGKDRTLKLQRRAFVPVLGAELEERDRGVYVSKLGVGEAATAGLKQGDRLRKVAGKDVDSRDAVLEALRGLGTTRERLSSVVYILQLAPPSEIARGFILPQGRPLPPGFPTPFLVLDGMVPTEVQWSTTAAASTYQVTLLTDASPTDVVTAYRRVLERERMRITADRAQGFATELEFTSADNASVGALSIDVFEDDDGFTQVMLQVQTARRGAGGGAVPTPSATGTAEPARTATPTATPR